MPEAESNGEKRDHEMSSDEFEKRINNKIETILETQANLQESIAGLVQVARIQDERLDRIERLTAENSQQIKELREGLREQKETVDALVRIVEGHLSGHK